MMSKDSDLVKISLFQEKLHLPEQGKDNPVS